MHPLISRLTRWLSIALLGLVLAACEHPTKSLRVVSWNVEWFPGRQPDASPEQSREHMQKTRQAIRALDPDVLLLQEIRDTAAAEELCSAIPGLSVHVASAFPGSTQNLIIASKLPADSGWFDRWKAGPVQPPRGYAFVALELPEKRFLLAYSLHLKSNGGDLQANFAQRQESARQLLPHLQQMLEIYSPRGACSVVIGGDFNTSLDDPRFTNDLTLRSMLSAGLHWTFAEVPFAKRITIPAEGPYPDNTFDHILTGGLGKPRGEIRVYEEVSDHRPVIVDIDLNSTTPLTKIDVQAALAKLVPTHGGTFSSGDHAGIAGAIGKQASIRGEVSNVNSPGRNITFINFAGNPRGKFFAIVKDADLPAVSAPFGGRSLKEALERRSIEVTGVITSFRGTPQIELRTADQIRVIE